MRNLLKCNSDFDFLLCKQQTLQRETTALIFPVGALAWLCYGKLQQVTVSRLDRRCMSMHDTIDDNNK